MRLWLRSWWNRKQIRKNCFHHQRTGTQPRSYIKSSIIDYRKLYECTKCEKRWVI